MKSIKLAILMLLPVAANAAHISETMTLAKGWNAIYLESTPTNALCVEFFADAYNPTIQAIKIYSGEVTAPQLRATEEGNTTYRLITGITDKYYTVNNLLEGGIFQYKVKAIYVDGNESAWSNVETVTIPGVNGLLGDVDNNGSVGISDITILIDALLSGDELPGRSDVNGDGIVNICDVTDLIDLLFR